MKIGLNKNTSDAKAVLRFRIAAARARCTVQGAGTQFSRGTALLIVSALSLFGAPVAASADPVRKQQTDLSCKWEPALQYGPRGPLRGPVRVCAHDRDHVLKAHSSDLCSTADANRTADSCSRPFNR